MKAEKLLITLCVFLTAFLIGGFALANDPSVLESINSDTYASTGGNNHTANTVCTPCYSGQSQNVRRSRVIEHHHPKNSQKKTEFNRHGP